MSESRDGQVITFYSYKGGTGRTMALANVAWILAANGHRVLVADWDLESPGLHRFFHPFIKDGALDSAGGVSELVRGYEWAFTNTAVRPPGWHRDLARVSGHAFSLDWSHFPGDGMIDFLPAGRHNRFYSPSMDWDDLYAKFGGGQFLDALRADMKHHYDYTLIDSRTGYSDIADICTIHLPDILVDCFTYSEQGIAGAAEVAATVKNEFESKKIRILPVPMRVDPAEKVKKDISKRRAMRRFADLPAGMTEAERNTYWSAVEVPYQSFYAYEEILSTFGDEPGGRHTLLAAYETLARYLTNGKVTSLPPLEGSLRERTSLRFQRQAESVEEAVTLRYEPADQPWAEWIGHLLGSAGVRVNDPHVGQRAPEATGLTARDVHIISKSNPNPGGLREGTAAPAPLLVYVDNVAQVAAPVGSASAFVFGLSEAKAAAERVLRLVGRSAGPDADAAGHGTRFPAQESLVGGLPAPNARFTGREDDLLKLRATLLDNGRAAVVQVQSAMPVALRGMGGIGKTQVAMKYAERFRSSYDVVWWINSDPVTFIDALIADLAARLNITPQATVLETARATLRALERGDHGRWLLIFDNAEDLEQVKPFLPDGGRTGHVLITSRNPSWGEQARLVEMDVFQRRESVAHLRNRVSSISTADADKIAEMLGDLPIAVAAAGAWLADTAIDVSLYIEQLERVGPDNAAVEATWNLSLNRLQERSPAGFRLLQLCSVLASDIALELVYSDEMARVLLPLNPTLADRMARGAVVQAINKLALLKLDPQNSQIQVHRLLQHVVRTRMTEQELDDTRHQVHLVLAASRPRGDVDEPETWRRFRMLWPHLEVSEATRCHHENVRQLLSDRVRYLWQRVDYPESKRLIARLEDAWSQMLGTDRESAQQAAIRRQLLLVQVTRANIHRAEGEFDAALALDERLLAEQTELLGTGHAHTLLTAGGLAADLRALGRYPEALKLDTATFAAWSENFGDDYSRTLYALNNLAASYRHMGDFRAARERDALAWERCKVVLDKEHTLTLVAAGNLGRDLREAGEYEASVTHLRTVAATAHSMLGATDKVTLNAQANLAVSLRSAGRAGAAEQLLDDTYEQLIDVAGATAPDTLACRLSRAVNLLALEKTERAASELAAVRTAYEDALGPRHPHTLLCVNNLAAAARADGDTAQALSLARTAMEQLGEVLGPEHPYALAARVNLAVCLADTGDLATALSLFQESAPQLAAKLGADHPDTVRCESNVAIVLKQLGRPEAETLLAVARDRLVARIGAGHPAVTALEKRRLLHRIIEPHPF